MNTYQIIQERMALLLEAQNPLTTWTRKIEIMRRLRQLDSLNKTKSGISAGI